MSFARFAAVTFAVLLLLTTIADAAGPVRPFKHGFWTGGAYSDDRTGAFTHCSAGVAYDSGINLFVLVTGEYRWWLGFINPKWSFTPNAKEPIRLLLDNGAAFNRLATIPSGQLLLVSLPDSSRLIDSFRRSSKLALEAEGKSFVFKLNDTPAVMDRLTNCVQTSLALKEKLPPPGSSSPATSSSPTLPSTAAASPSEAKAGPVEVDQAGTPPPSGPASATASVPPASSSTPASAAAETQPASPADGSHTPVAAALQTAAPEKTTALSSLPDKSASATESPSNLRDEEATPSSGRDEPAKARAPQSGGAAQPSPLASQSTPREPATPKEEVAAASTPSSGAMPAAIKPADAETHTGPTSSPPALAFTTVPPSAPPPMPSSPAFGPRPTGANAIEEERLATDFISRARLTDAHLVVADKPPALSDFAAVWRSEDAAGAVKIIPPGPDVSAIGIASNLIAVDPQVCKGDFTAARFRSNIGKTVAFTAILSCTDANQQRVTEYIVTPRHQGGFAVFAVIHSKAAGEMPGADQQKIEILSRAAIEAAANEG